MADRSRFPFSPNRVPSAHDATTGGAKDGAKKSHTNSGSIVKFQTLALPENCLGANDFVVGSNHDHTPRSMRIAVVCDRYGAGADDRWDDP